MECQKIINLLDNEYVQPSKFGTKNWLEISNQSHGTYATKNIKFKTAILK